MARIKPQALLQQSKKKKAPSSVSILTIAVYVLVVIVTVFFLSATYKHWKRRSLIQTDGSFSSVEEGDNATVHPNKPTLPKYAVLKTSKGAITVELYREGSPEVVDEFIESCKKGQFGGMEFNRVIKNFVIQGGDVEGPGATDDWTAKGKHYGQLDTSLKHEAFMLGTSKARHNGGGFDLIITTAPIPDLNHKINVFGRVVKGEDVVQEIEEVDTDEHYRPKTRINITEVILKQKL